MNPKLTVCMPVYNQGRFLSEAIESVLVQTFRDFEFIIIDDKSTDDSAEIIGKYAATDPRIRFQVNKLNIGMVNNWNKCLESARGEYIKYLFGDDTFHSRTALEQMADVLDSNRDVALVSCARHEIDETSRILRVLSEYSAGASYKGTDIITDCIVEQRNRIGEPSAVMFRKKDGLRGFDTKYRQIVDLEMWFHILERGAFGYIQEPLVAFRVHPLQQTRQNMLNLSLIDEPFLLLERYSHKPYLKLTRFKREYMYYTPVYSIWKLYKKHKKLSKQKALEHIKKRYMLAKFIIFYPVFKAYKIYRRMRRQAA